MDFKDEIPMYGFLFVNGLNPDSPNKRRLEENNESGESNPVGKGRKNHPEFPSPIALSPGGWAARCSIWIAHLHHGPQLKRSPCDFRRLSSSSRGVATQAMSWRCLNEVGEENCLDRKLWENRF